MHTKNTLAALGIATIVLTVASMASATTTPYTVTVTPGHVTITAATGWKMQQTPPGILTCKTTSLSGKVTETRVPLTTTDTTATGTGKGACKVTGAVYTPQLDHQFIETVNL